MVARVKTIACLNMVAYVKRNVAIATAVGAVLVSLLLVVFFGAWAVSASGEADLAGALSSAAAGFSDGVAPPAMPSDATTGVTVTAADVGADNAPRLAISAGGENNPANTWWGKALLGACPLH